MTEKSLIEKVRESFLERKDSPEKRKEFLIKSGILTKDGGYNPKYFPNLVKEEKTN